MGASWLIPNKLIHVEVQIVKIKLSFLSQILRIGEEGTLTLAADSWQLFFFAWFGLALCDSGKRLFWQSSCKLASLALECQLVTCPDSCKILRSWKKVGDHSGLLQPKMNHSHEGGKWVIISYYFFIWRFPKMVVKSSKTIVHSSIKPTVLGIPHLQKHHLANVPLMAAEEIYRVTKWASSSFVLQRPNMTRTSDIWCINFSRYVYFARLYIYIYMQIHIHIDIHIHIHIHIHMYIYIYVCMSIYRKMYLYIYIYTNT